MKGIIALTISTFLLIVVYSKDQNGGCLYTSTKHQWKIGESYNPPGECVILKCQGKNQFSAKTCPRFKANDCTLVPQDNSKPFPECCPHIDCNFTKY